MVAEVSLALRWMPLDITDDKSTLVQVISWANVDPDLCHQMASLGLNELMLIIYPLSSGLLHWYVEEWLTSIYISFFYVNVITYPCPNLNACLGNLC